MLLVFGETLQRLYMDQTKIIMYNNWVETMRKECFHKTLLIAGKGYLSVE